MLFLYSCLIQHRYKCAGKTQLQWQVEAVTVCPEFPLGVKTMYRRACAESINEIVEDPRYPCGVYAQAADVFSFPQKDEEKGIMVDGMYVLQSLPTEFPVAMPFPDNSLHLMTAMLDKINNKFNGQNDRTVVDAWVDFAAKDVPLTNDVEKHVLDHPLQFPLGEFLFSDAPVDATPIVPADSEASKDIKRVRCTDCVSCSRRGVHRPAKDPENCTRLETVYDAEGNPMMIDAMPKRVSDSILQHVLLHVGED